MTEFKGEKNAYTTNFDPRKEDDEENFTST